MHIQGVFSVYFSLFGIFSGLSNYTPLSAVVLVLLSPLLYKLRTTYYKTPGTIK